MKTASPCYKPFEVQGGWSIFWVYPDGEKELVDENGRVAENGHAYIYPQRQGAYRRSKQLNEENNPPYPLYVRMRVWRKDCPALRIKLQEMIPSHGIYVLDPLYQVGEHEYYNENMRFVQFGRIVRWKASDRDPKLDSIDVDVDNPIESDFMQWLDGVEKEFHILETKCSRHSFGAT